MHILFLFNKEIVAYSGGVERVTSLLAESLHNRGYEISFFSYAPLTKNTVAVPLASKDLEGIDIKQHTLPVNSLNFEKDFINFLQAKRVDRVVVQSFDPLITKLLEIMRGRVKTLLVFHNQPFAYAGKERFVKTISPWDSLKTKGKILKVAGIVAPRLFGKFNNKQLSKRYLRFIDNVEKFILLSPRFKDRVLRYIPQVPTDKLTAINNPNTFLPPISINYEVKENVILFVGRLVNPQKNIFGFLKMWKEFHKLHPEWEAKVVGDGEHRRMMEEYVRRHKISNVSFEGNQEEISEYYKRAKILCMTSAYEGWGMVLTEAMAYGCVPVAFDSYEAVHDIIETGVNGLLIPPFNPRHMAEGISGLVKDEGLLRQMAEKGMEKIKDFSLETTTNKWETLLNSL